ncbi:putative F-box protein At3g16210 [Vicia villosa]|uniref:putative F-box protein At3g16210 n=1 Tax=Vicia villosa TaxID=3911 RepID=UPI00273B9B26|nr:putative F-box protein At3g16210 [Vicia villosa]
MQIMARLLKDPIFINMHIRFNSPTHFILFRQHNIHSLFISLPLNPNPNSVLNTQRLRPPPCEREFSIEAYCNGLLLITVLHEKAIILWNPSISQYRVVPPSPFFENQCSRGFHRNFCAIGYNSSENDYKIITYTYFNRTNYLELLSLNSNSWKQLPDAEYAPYNMEMFSQRPVSINDAMYWIASDKASYELLGAVFHVIMRFDLCQERVSLVSPPPNDTGLNIYWIGDINQSLCMRYFSNKNYFHIWSTRDDINWVKLITVSNIPEPNLRDPALYYVPLCFNEYGELLIRILSYDTFHGRRHGLVAFDPNEQNYRGFVLEENTIWLEQTIYRDSLVFPNEPSNQTCSHSFSGSLKKMLLRFSHIILSRFACNATSRMRL